MPVTYVGAALDEAWTSKSPADLMFPMYQEFRPNPRLAPLVECGWARSGSAARPLRVLPDGCVDLFVSSLGDVMIAGPTTGFYDLRSDKECTFVGLRLRPGAAAAVVGRPVNDLTDNRVPLDSILGVRAHLMAEKVFATASATQCVAALQNILAGYLADAEPSTDDAVTRGDMDVAATSGSPRIGAGRCGRPQRTAAATSVCDRRWPRPQAVRPDCPVPAPAGLDPYPR
jgi:hypothetical protein